METKQVTFPLIEDILGHTKLPLLVRVLLVILVLAHYVVKPQRSEYCRDRIAEIYRNL